MKLKWKTDGACKEIVKDIDEHQDDYLPHMVDGYYINRLGHELVHLKRKDSVGKDVTGYIEYNDLRKDSIEFYNGKKAEMVTEALNVMASNSSRSNGCIVM